MIKALLKKELLEAFVGIVQNKKTKKRRSLKGIIGMSVLFVALFGYLLAMFYFFADKLCKPLVAMGFDWLYFAIVGILALALAVIGSIFSTYTSLYVAKDNDMLLSMPIPTNKILFARLAGVYILGLVYELLVMLPATVVYFINAPFNPLSVIFCLIIPFVLSFFVLSLSCVLGWLVALVSSKLRNKNIITVVLSLGFIAVYYYACGNMSNIFDLIITNPQGVGNKIKSLLYLLYQMGKAAEGNALSMLIFVAIVFAIFAVVYLILQRSFLKLATVNLGVKKKKYVARSLKTRSVSKTLLAKEFKRFLSSANYMLNCGLGVVIMLVFAVVVVIKRQSIMFIAGLLEWGDLLSLILCVMICMMTTMNNITAPSVSLEGKNIWILQTLPVSGWEVLRAKLMLHLILTAVPAAVLTLCVEAVFRPSLFFVIMMPLSVMLFILMMALLGLAVNLKLPNLNWTNETVPVKQGGSIMISLFGGWAIVLALGALYYLLPTAVTPAIYISCVCVLMLAVNFALLSWLKTKGGHIFEKLQ